MSKKIAMIFPGQGSQKVGMLSQLSQQESVVADIFNQASEVLNIDLWKITQENPDDLLNQTAYTQPALLAASYALWKIWLKRGGQQPEIMAGHSLGEYSALVCAQAMPFEDAIHLVHKRGIYMQEAVPQGQGAMAAIIGLSPEQVAQACMLVGDNAIVQPANINAHGQVVISGESEAVQAAMTHAKSLGAKLAKLLPVSVPSHCSLMKPAAQKLAEDLNKISFKLPKISVLHNVNVEVSHSVEDLKARLIEQLYSPVRWVETIEKMEAHGVFSLFECGPGKVLAGLSKRITANLTTLALDTDDISSLIEEVVT